MMRRVIGWSSEKVPTVYEVLDAFNEQIAKAV